MKKTALVTGGSGGIGSEICRALAEDGWQVAVCYKNGRATAEALVSELKERGLYAEVFYCDIGDKDSMRGGSQGQFGLCYASCKQRRHSGYRAFH